MISKDWKRNIAEGIVDALDGDYSGTYEERSDEFRNIIDQHCPFKDDIAYMPVPRCSSCLYWQREAKQRNGTCSIHLFSTVEYFGCVRYEVKEQSWRQPK